MTNRDLLTPQDYAFLRAQETHTHAFGYLLDTAHMEAASSRIEKELERLQKQADDTGRGEAANCYGLALAAVLDAKDEL